MHKSALRPPLRFLVLIKEVKEDLTHIRFNIVHYCHECAKMTDNAYPAKCCVSSKSTHIYI